mmetsp:Transcript_107464/g.302402  ORF Transcript_107464/g.302402 Transcript_107464/m.302402 type:complete len:612 (+) Transcript_107464:103-1938(+)
MEMGPEDVATAHKLIDLAKEGRWKSLYKALDARRDLVDARPPVREYGILHQAAFLGSRAAVLALIDKYGADPTQLTKSGRSVEEVAVESKHAQIAKLVKARVPGGTPGGGVDLTPEKKPKPSGSKAAVGGVAPAALTPDLVQAAHKVIDLAKDGAWKDVYAALDGDVSRCLVNVRPEVREYAVLHQAAYLGDVEAVVDLIDKYGADPSQRTRLGRSVVEVATMRGHGLVAKIVQERCDGGTTGCGSVGASADAEEEDDGMEMVQMPDGSWKVSLKSKGAGPEPPPAAKGPEASAASAPTAGAAPEVVQDSAEAAPAAAPAPESGKKTLPADAPAAKRAKTSSATHVDARAASTCAEATAVVGSGAVAEALTPADEHFPEKASYHVFRSDGADLACTLSWKGFGASGQTYTLQLLERSDMDAYCLWARRGGAKAKGQEEPVHFFNAESAAAAFAARFLEKTGNKWQDRARCKAFFGKYAYVPDAAGSAAADVAAASGGTAGGVARKAAPAKDVAQAAHKAIDMAKAGRWKELYVALDARPELVNVLPDAREYAVLHQAVFHGDEDAVSSLIDKYAADPALRTKSGASAIEVAEAQGHNALATSLRARLAKAS